MPMAAHHEMSLGWLQWWGLHVDMYAHTYVSTSAGDHSGEASSESSDSPWATLHTMCKGCAVHCWHMSGSHFVMLHPQLQWMTSITRWPHQMLEGAMSGAVLTCESTVSRPLDVCESTVRQFTGRYQGCVLLRCRR